MILTIERPVAGGRMLARHDGQIVFVAGTIPGERVRVALDRVTKNSAWAHVVEIIEPSPDRRELWCDPSCGGLSYAHIAYDRQRALKGEVVADAFRRLSNIDLGTPPAVAASPEHDYRLRSRLHIRGGRAGFFREGTHVLCDAAPTGQLSDACIAAIEATMARLGSRTAECDAVVIAENVAATERVLHLEPREGARLDDLAGTMKLVSSTTGLTTTVRGRTVALAGNPTVTDSAATLLGAESPIGGLPVWTRKASSFFQGNRFLTGALVRRVLDLAPGDSVADLYAGVGLFAVALAARGSRVIAVEGDQSSGSDLEANAAPWKERLRVIRRAVEDVVMRPPPEPFDALVIDPPRSGVSAAAIAGMLSWKPPLIVYVSCDPPTLARDAARIVQAGYQLRSVDALDFFPNTPHVETVARFTSGPVPDSPSDRAPA